MSKSSKMERYLKHLRYYGPEGLLEVAESDLSERESERLAKAIKDHKKAARRKR